LVIPTPITNVRLLKSGSCSGRFPCGCIGWLAKSSAHRQSAGIPAGNLEAVVPLAVSTDPASGVGILAALAAGIVSFLSPCVLPLVPGYLSAVTGVSAAELDEAGWRRVLGPSLLFVASFSLIFILLGLTATGLGSFLDENKALLTKISAALIIAMGLLFVSSLFITRLNREWHVEALLERAGKGGPVIAGAAFAIAWTPCIGPTLGAILSAAALTDSAGRGAILLAVYSAGLAIPFLLTALAFSQMTTAFAVVKRHYQAIVAVGGLILIAMGVLIWTGELFQLNIEAQNWLEKSGIDFWNSA
jgi:cytochrome c-type biogenesis protein